MHGTRTRRTRALAVAAVATGLLVGGITAGTSGGLTATESANGTTDTIANAAAGQSKKQRKAQGGSCLTGAKKAANRKFLKTVYDWPDNPDYVTSLPGPGYVKWEHKVEASNKVSATLGATYQQISAGVQFDVTLTRSVTRTTMVKMPGKAHYLVRASNVYKRYRFDVYEEHGFWNWHGDYLVCQSYHDPVWVMKGSSTADRWWTTTHRVTNVTRAHRTSDPTG